MRGVVVLIRNVSSLIIEKTNESSKEAVLKARRCRVLSREEGVLSRVEANSVIGLDFEYTRHRNRDVCIISSGD